MKTDDIANRRFSRAFRGYDIREVDAFLDEIIRDMERAGQDAALLEIRNQALIELLAKNGIPLNEK